MNIFYTATIGLMMTFQYLHKGRGLGCYQLVNIRSECMYIGKDKGKFKDKVSELRLVTPGWTVDV
jgi:hypothetical protein